VFAQDGDAIWESGRLNVVDHLLEPKNKGKQAPRFIRGSES
jgi:hypothetical protein